MDWKQKTKKFTQEIFSSTVKSFFVKFLVALTVFLTGLLYSRLADTLYWNRDLTIPLNHLMLGLLAVITAAAVPVIIIRRVYNPRLRSQTLNGYHRTLYKLTCRPYRDFGTRTDYTLRMDWIFSRVSSEEIGPYYIRSCEPRSELKGGIPKITPEDFTCLYSRKGQDDESLTPDIRPSLHGHYRITIPPPRGGFKPRDRVTLKGSYYIIGQHARSKYEKQVYLSRKDTLDHTARMLVERKASCEMLYNLVKYAEQYKVKVSFPEGWEARRPRNQKDQALITVDSRIAEKYSKKLKPKWDNQDGVVEIEYRMPMRGMHGLVLYWRLPDSEKCQSPLEAGSQSSKS